MTTYEEHRAKVAAEQAAWLSLYQTVRDAIALGFVPAAYGNVGRGEGDPIQAPPTKFGYPAGGIAYPFHAHGPGPGSRYGVWTYQHGSPDELRDQPVWVAGDWTGDCRGYGSNYGSYGATFDQAIAACIEAGNHHRQYFVVVDWIGVERNPSLTVEEWIEVIALDFEPRRTQLRLFEEPPVSRLTGLQRALSGQLRDEPVIDGRQTVRLPRGSGYHDLEDMVDRANRIRWQTGTIPPAPTGIPFPASATSSQSVEGSSTC